MFVRQVARTVSGYRYTVLHSNTMSEVIEWTLRPAGRLQLSMLAFNLVLSVLPITKWPGLH